MTKNEAVMLLEAARAEVARLAKELAEAQVGREREADARLAISREYHDLLAENERLATELVNREGVADRNGELHRDVLELERLREADGKACFATYQMLNEKRDVLRGLRVWLVDSIETTRRKVSAFQAKGLDCEAHELNQRITAAVDVLAKLDAFCRERGVEVERG